MAVIDDVLKEYAISDFSEDFGFSGVSEEEYNEAIDEAVVDTEAAVITEYKQKLLTVEKLIVPFMVKLMQSDAVYIKWPPETRKPAIKAQLEKIVKITRS